MLHLTLPTLLASLFNEIGAETRDMRDMENDVCKVGEDGTADEEEGDEGGIRNNRTVTAKENKSCRELGLERES